MSPDLRGGRGGNVVIYWLCPGIHRPAFEDASPPRGRIERSLAIVQGRIDVTKKIPNYVAFVSICIGVALVKKTRIKVHEGEARTMSNNHSTNLILGHAAVQDQTKRHQNPGQIWRGEDQQAEEAQASLWVAAGPDVDQAAAEGGAEERNGKQR